MRRRVVRKNQQRGALTVEAAIGAVVFLAFVGFIFDFGMLVHRHALLVDVTLKTVQQVTRDPQASESVETLHNRSEQLFTHIAARISASENPGMKVSKIEVISGCQEVRISSEWEVPCAFCFFGKFHKKVTAHSLGVIESPRESFVCTHEI